MYRKVAAMVFFMSVLVSCPVRASDDLVDQVRQTEIAFARTMAERDHAAFVSFLSSEAVFLSGKTAHRGRDAVAAAWKRYFEGPDAPFSWRPETVEVVESGWLAISTGPVFAPDGSRLGTFTSTWRKEPDGAWRIVLDSGCPPCDCGKRDAVNPASIH